jgi:hypothetical protein
MLQLAEPYSPIVYFLHTILGTLGVLLAVAALAQVKGSPGHVRAGRGFVIASMIAAITALAFSVTRPSPLAIASAFMVLALVTSAVVALRPASAGVRRVEWGATVAMGFAWLILASGGAMAAAVLTGIITIPPPPPGAQMPPLSVILTPGLYALFPTYFLIDDWRFRRQASDRAARAVPRHLSRMAFAFAIAVHAPVVTFADDLGLSPLVAFFGPFLLWPVILYALRRHPRLRVRAAESQMEPGV